MTTRRRSTSRSRSRGRGRRSGAWPWWLRLLIGGSVVAGVVLAVLWFDALATWVKVTSVAGALALVALWWVWTRRHEIAAEMARRDSEQRRRPAGRDGGPGGPGGQGGRR